MRAVIKPGAKYTHPRLRPAHLPGKLPDNLCFVVCQAHGFAGEFLQAFVDEMYHFTRGPPFEVAQDGEDEGFRFVLGEQALAVDLCMSMTLQ